MVQVTEQKKLKEFLISIILLSNKWIKNVYWNSVIETENSKLRTLKTSKASYTTRQIVKKFSPFFPSSIRLLRQSPSNHCRELGLNDKMYIYNDVQIVNHFHI